MSVDHRVLRLRVVRRARLAAFVGVAAIGCLAGKLLAADNVEGPWGTVHGDIFGTAATADIPYTLGEGPIEEKWRIDVVAAGHDRPGGRASITFDKEGNLYWISSSGGGTGGVIRLVSASPEGEIRWNGNEGEGTVHQIGSIFSGASAVVGEELVYAVGDVATTLAIAAYRKDTGELVWFADLPPSTIASGVVLTPVLHDGKLYVAGLEEGKTRDIWRVDAATGDVDWGPSTLAEVGIAASHQMALVPDAFGPGEHGLYFNGDSESGADGIAEVYGIKVTETEASVAWQSEGGKVARSHVIHSEATGLLYTLTWSNYGAQCYVFDPVTGLVSSHANSQNSGHGFYDVGALDFEGTSLIGGGFDGLIFRYDDVGGGTMTDTVIYKGGTQFRMPYWGETRVNGQLLQDPEGRSILLAATNSLPGCCTSKVIALDVTEGRLLWQFDTGTVWPHQFQYAGGPVMGPDGKVYLFPRPADGTTALVALGPADSEPPPTAGFLLADLTGGELPAGACLSGGDSILADGTCSAGRDLKYTYSADPPDGVDIVQDPADGPAASIQFRATGTFIVTLTVENAGGVAECSSAEICVNPVAPVCALAVTDSEGAPIDDADDEDAIACLPAGGTAIADAGASLGGDLEYDFAVVPSEGVTIDRAGGTGDPRASITIADPGEYVVTVEIANGLGDTTCQQRICVEGTRGGSQKPGDTNQDGKFDISDPVSLLNHLFLGTNPTLPCGNGSTDDAANRALLDLNEGGSGGIDLSDAIYGLNFLFIGGPPPVQCEGNVSCPCIEIPGCADITAGDCGP